MRVSSVIIVNLIWPCSVHNSQSADRGENDLADIGTQIHLLSNKPMLYGASLLGIELDLGDLSETNGGYFGTLLCCPASALSNSHHFFYVHYYSLTNPQHLSNCATALALSGPDHPPSCESGRGEVQ